MDVFKNKHEDILINAILMIASALYGSYPMHIKKLMTFATLNKMKNSKYNEMTLKSAGQESTPVFNNTYILLLFKNTPGFINPLQYLKLYVKTTNPFSTGKIFGFNLFCAAEKHLSSQ